MESEINAAIKKWALANAVEHGGNANLGAVMGKLLAEFPNLRPKARELMSLVKKIVDEINRLSLQEQTKLLHELGPPEVVRREKRVGLPELPDVDKYPGVVTRFAPNPNGPLHIGHVRAALLSHEYARIYGGKFILRFEDTNPLNSLLEMYDMIKKDLAWLEINWDEEHVQSDRLERYYFFAERLLEEGKAYVCTCKAEEFKRLRDKSKACPCRELPTNEQIERWQAMVIGDLHEGQAVVRIKTDLTHPNPAVRDWPALRVVTAPHPRVGSKYRVWPLYNFSASIDDHEMGITHIIRGKEHIANEQCQRFLYEHLGWSYPTAVQYGRLKIGGAVLSKTKIMNGIRSGEFSGYDDPRLGTIAALRRRGILPQSIRAVIIDVGPTPVDASLSWETLFAYNRKLVDAGANRYFFVPNPVELKISGVPDLKEVKIRLHPSLPERGWRNIPIDRKEGFVKVHVAKADMNTFKVGQIVRLKDLMNVRILSIDPNLIGEFAGFEILEVPKIQWVSKDAVEVSVIRPDGTVEGGIAEPGVSNLKEGDIVQFERYGFVRIDSVEPKIIAVFGHL
ncbi:MAG: hypothetical protein APU95_02755 [Hadesarchaea archaeon YNP_N21]|nr:MAG: hypothetical protein APU95_02755 [Hadesarchaea archaeon YNP_N21]